jgi:hypothetical protein
VIIKTVLFKRQLTPGSDASISFHKDLAAVADTKVFLAESIQAILRFKYTLLTPYRWFLIIQYLAFMACVLFITDET